MKEYNVAVLGATGAVGQEMLKVLEALGAGLYVLSQDEAVEWSH